MNMRRETSGHDESRTGKWRTAFRGLILRESPFGQVRCHRPEPVVAGLIWVAVSSTVRLSATHFAGTPAVKIDLGLDPQPVWVYQWLPD